MLFYLQSSAPNHVLTQAVKCVFWGTHGLFTLVKYQVHNSLVESTTRTHKCFCLAFLTCLAAMTCVIFWAATENRKLDQDKARLRASLYASPTAERLAQSPKRMSPLFDDDELSEVSTCVTMPNGILSSCSFTDSDCEFRPSSRKPCPAPLDWSVSSNAECRAEGKLIAQRIFTMELMSKYPRLVNFQTLLITGLLLSMIGALMTADTPESSLLISTLLASTLFVTLSNSWEVLKCFWVCLREPLVLSTHVRQERIALWSYLIAEAFIIMAVLSFLVGLSQHALLLILSVPYLYGIILYITLSTWMFASPFLPKLSCAFKAQRS